MWTIILIAVIVGLLVYGWQHSDEDSRGFIAVGGAIAFAILLLTWGCSFTLAVILGVVAFLVILFVLDQNQGQSKSSTSTISSSSAGTNSGEHTFTAMNSTEAVSGKLTLWEDGFFKHHGNYYRAGEVVAEYSSGTVFAINHEIRTPIGSWEKSGNEYRVFSEQSKHGCCGYISQSTIRLSREFIYRDLEHRLFDLQKTSTAWQQYRINKPDIQSKDIAHLASGSMDIIDNETGKIVATYSGNSIGAAAAFLCLIAYHVRLEPPYGSISSPRDLSYTLRSSFASASRYSDFLLYTRDWCIYK